MSLIVRARRSKGAAISGNCASGTPGRNRTPSSASSRPGPAACQPSGTRTRRSTSWKSGARRLGSSIAKFAPDIGSQATAGVSATVQRLRYTFPLIAARDIEGQEHDTGNQNPKNEDADPGQREPRVRRHAHLGVLDRPGVVNGQSKSNGKAGDHPRPDGSTRDSQLRGRCRQGDLETHVQPSRLKHRFAGTFVPRRPVPPGDSVPHRRHAACR